MAITAPPIPALQQIMEDEFNGSFEVSDELLSVGTTVTQIIPHDYERLGLVIINTSQDIIYVAPFGSVSTASAIIMLSNGSSISMTAKDDLVLVGHEWYALGAVGAQSIYVLSVRRYRAI